MAIASDAHLTSTCFLKAIIQNHKNFKKIINYLDHQKKPTKNTDKINNGIP
ncbi:hypothetical protein MC7420_344 [Coleofasciculus chthonoplastes PCC 7420]|uniref:Uncharacterized protein n=1 Tax=Coleofasciculus chthonoplastes PCC 7420 TaxID=118168 RepID=B4VL93_9CYAN|nr:hypothetical protein MC7420_344 [Coleofasciculus chthonoplastes PCC 7420]